MIVAFALGLFLQDDMVRLVEQLGSPSIEERDAAEARLREIGHAALPALRKAAESDDPEVALRARRLVHLIPVEHRLTANLLKVVPNVESRVATGDPGVWPKLFLELAEPDRGKGRAPERHPAIHRDDLGPLVPMAIAHARNEEEQRDVFMAALCWWGLGAPWPEVVQLLDADPHPDVRRMAARALSERVVRETIPVFVRLFEDAPLRLIAVRALADMRVVEAVPRIRGLLKDDDDKVRRAAKDALAWLENRDVILNSDPGARGKGEDPGLFLKRLEDPKIRIDAASQLCRMGRFEGVPAILETGDFIWLNALRRPDLWAKLEGLSVSGKVEWRMEIERFAGAAGMSLIWPEGRFHCWPNKKLLDLRDGPITGTEALQQAVHPSCSVVFEPGEIVILPRRKAETFWKKWWNEKKKR